ncbi:PilZ domain-containing protein [Chromobacterium amazonense]|uniref:PilZ domain-containing protein n=2 Tax=Chromobacterium amazonense TaxID=1382803 RepID=A0ABU8UYL9_9NEIS|nr:PilZ domain-containing protein [Chromobacterium amazonense]MDE1712367.1 PilZ domain-containing protein [Chromobacterium amazonense]MDQ4541787.1 PilZ domain-containing protein [Chromobacterium amazonense]
MSRFDAYYDRRRGRRISMGCKARIKCLTNGQTYYGECVDLSVDGMALRSVFVPQYGERLNVIVLVPGVGGAPGKPFEAEVEVKRCNEVQRGTIYEIGVRIVLRKS